VTPSFLLEELLSDVDPGFTVLLQAVKKRKANIKKNLAIFCCVVVGCILTILF
jgi:hypothetical protein